MSKLPWLRLYTDTVDNEKIRLLAFEDRWHFIALLCLKQQGVLDSNPDLIERKISLKLGVQLRELDEIKRRLIGVELIGPDWVPVGWESKQYKSDSSTARVHKHRENKKLKKCNVTETLLKRKCNVKDTEQIQIQNKQSSNSIESDLFDIFWKAYPKKDKKKQSKTAFNRLTKSNQQLAIADSAKRFINTDKQFIPMASSYLNGERWNDELTNENELSHASIPDNDIQQLEREALSEQSSC